MVQPGFVGKRLKMKAFAKGMLSAVALLVCSYLQAQEMKAYLVVQRRAGVIEFMDPATLATVG